MVPESSNEVNVLRDWLQDVATAPFHKVVLPSLDTKDEGNTWDVVYLTPELVERVTDWRNGEEVVYSNGTRYYGCRHNESGLPIGRGQVILPSGVSLEGDWLEGRLEGVVREVDPSDGSVWEIMYRDGVPNGTYRHSLSDGQLVSYGRCKGRKRIGPCLRVGSGGNSYYIHGTNLLEQEEGEQREEGVFLYPSLTKAIVGVWDKPNIEDCHYSTAKYRLQEGQYWTVLGVTMKAGWPCLEIGEEGRGEVEYDPPTFMRISRTPLIEDEYEMETVLVKESSVYGAGEGLFVRTGVQGGDLVALFSGNKIEKTNNKRGIRWGDEEWSDFRLTLDKSVDLDIPPDQRLTSQYRATLGHKACHHFSKKNAAFREFEHPRFGIIMSVVALRDIQAGEEVFVSYNYCLGGAPPWYQDLWWQYCLSQGWGREKAAQWVSREVASSGIPVIIPDFLK